MTDTDTTTPKRRAAKTRAATTPRANAIGVATRQRIILAAERLFAERGIAAVSLREVGQAAGQRNNVAIQYHFGNREGLVRAILAYRSAVTQEMRAHMLADMLSAGREPDVRELVEAIVRPLASQLVKGNHYIGFQARYVVERGPIYSHAHRESRLQSDRPALSPESAYILLREALRRRIPQLPDALFEARWDIAIDTNVLTLATYQMAMSREELQTTLDVLVEDLIDVITGVLTAPSQTSAPDGQANGKRRGARTRVATSGS